MKLTIINGTNRHENRSLLITRAVARLAKTLGHEVAVVDLANFNQLFRGDYVTLDSATPNQRQDLTQMMAADLLVFIVPTYHSGIPSPLKNFLDSLKCRECYEGKVISLIAGSDHNQNLGARQAEQVINGILSYQKSVSFVTPRITILDFDEIDRERLNEHLIYCAQFVARFHQHENTHH